MPVRPGLPTWLENGGALICPAGKPSSLASAVTVKSDLPVESRPKTLAELRLPAKGETMSAELAIQLMLLGEYGIIQDYLDRHLAERFPPP